MALYERKRKNVRGDRTWQHVSPWREFREAGRVLNRSSALNDQVYGRLVKDAAATAFRYATPDFPTQIIMGHPNNVNQ